MSYFHVVVEFRASEPLANALIAVAELLGTASVKMNQPDEAEVRPTRSETVNPAPETKSGPAEPVIQAKAEEPAEPVVQAKAEESAKAEGKKFTLEDVREALRGYSAREGSDAAVSLLKEFGVDKIKDLSTDQWASLIEKTKS